ncbi:MAG: YjfB family protein [Tissierellales bacterium]|jgi:hypothetical protein|nr:YjfB family protein [Tissierellales bacterium]
MDVLSIAKFSMASSQATLKTSASIAVMKKALDQSKVMATQNQQMIDAQTKAIQRSVQSHLGGKIDTKA